MLAVAFYTRAALGLRRAKPAGNTGRSKVYGMGGPRSTESSRTTSGSSRRRSLLKLGVQVVCSVRRIVLRLPRATPDLAAWRHIAFALGARAG